VVQLLGELHLTPRRMNVLARILSGLYIRAVDLCGLDVRLILTHRYDPEARLTDTYRIRTAGDLWVMKGDLICRIRAPKITHTASCGLDAAVDVGRISFGFRNHWTSRHFTGAHNIYFAAASFHLTSTHNNDSSALRRVSIRASTHGTIANPKSMDKHNDMANAKMTDMATAKMPDMINNPIDEVVKHAITNSVMDIICNVVDIMVETNSPMPLLKKTMTKDLMTSIDARVEALVDEHVNNSLEGARTKAALEAELEMVSLMLFLSGRSRTDHFLGQETVGH